MRRAVALLQHHDAVTGTEKQHVADDYSLRLAMGEVSAKAILMRAVEERLGLQAKSLKMCERTNSTFEDCPTSELDVGDKMTLIVENSGDARSETIEVRVPGGLSIDLAQGSKKIDSDIICHF